jgi:salicylate hydroxylase
MLPYLGQGSAMAIEDGCVLAAAVAYESEDFDAALATYERLRMPRTRTAVLGSRARARENHLTSRWAQIKRDLKFALRDRFGIDRTAFDPAQLYRYDAGLGPLSAG